MVGKAGMMVINGWNDRNDGNQWLERHTLILTCSTVIERRVFVE